MKTEKKLCCMTIDNAMRNGNRSKGQDYYQIHLDGQKFTCPNRSRLFALALARGYTHVSLYYTKTGLTRTVKL